MAKDPVEEFIRKHGVTKCPPGVAAPTTAKVSPETAQAHRERGIGLAQNAGPVKPKKGWARFWQTRTAKVKHRRGQARRRSTGG